MSSVINLLNRINTFSSVEISLDERCRLVLTPHVWAQTWAVRTPLIFIL